MFGPNNSGSKHKPKTKGDYRHVSLDEFSDDDSDHEDLTPPSQSSSRHSSVHGGIGGAGTGAISSNSSGYSDNPAAAQSIGRQHALMKQQDEGLEMLSQSAERLGAMSLQINDEIGFQNKMLDEMESDLERADEDLDMVTRQTKRFIEQAGGTKNCIIITILCVIVLVLILLLIYT
jgi:hypothetical protein